MSNALITKLGTVKNIVSVKFRQSKPEIKLVLGIVGVLGGTILACTKTKQAVDAYQTTKAELEEVENKTQKGTKEAAIGRTTAYARFVYRLVRIYGLSVLLWIGGIGTIVDSHADLRKQNGQLLLDSVALKKMFDEYRARVAEEIGEEEERKLYFDAQENEVDVIEENPETGTKKIVRKKVDTIKGNNGSKFARNFSARTSYGFDIRSYADFFLEARIKNLNARLKMSPFITMNDVYDELEMKPEFGRCADGLDWGWVWNPNDPDGPNEIIVERLNGWEEVYDERENKTYWAPCLRLDFNPQPLRGRI